MPGDRERILTTHTGSLPRPEGLRALLLDRESGRHDDEVTFHGRIREAVSDCVHKQLACGIDLVSDGEMSKPGYSSYVKDRLSGFGRTGAMPIPADLEEYPGYARRMMADEGLRSLALPLCIGPVGYVDERPLRRDLDDLHGALKNGAARQAFMTAASPGVISLFLRNQYYPSHAAYVQALSEAMRIEYRAIHEAGFILQIDCPDLAMGRHTLFAGGTLEEFRRSVALHVEALNHAVDGIPPDRMRIHLCWGNYEGPHHRDVPLASILDLVLRARPSGISFCAANPRHEHEWAVWEEMKIPDDKVIIPGVIDSTSNFIEHPELVAERILRFTRIVGTDRVIGGTDCGFGTFAGLTTVDADIVWGKLSALVDGARLASTSSHHLTRVQLAAHF
jgi:5-methyltetrahydropteroyltriglutamate--homocysteine methyltransferase